jgi:hypothetical protein
MKILVIYLSFFEIKTKSVFIWLKYFVPILIFIFNKNLPFLYGFRYQKT